MAPNPEKQLDVNAFYSKILNVVDNYKEHNHTLSKIKGGIKVLLGMMNTSAVDNINDKYNQYIKLRELINSCEAYLNGNKSKTDIMEKDFQSIRDRLSVAIRGVNSSYGFTKMHKESLGKAAILIEKYGEMLDDIKKEYQALKSSFNQSIIDNVD